MENNDIVDAKALLEDLISGDAQRIWSSSSALVTLRDPVALDLLANHAAEIQAKTNGIELGGALFPNRERLKFALRKLDYWKNKTGCLCHLYPDYLMYDPKREEESGNARITETRTLEGGWIDYYTVACTICATVFQVKEGEYHYTWWDWKIVADKDC